MNTQEAISNSEQFASDNGREGSFQVEETGKRTDEIVTTESTSPVHIAHHSTCCCESCWTETIKSYI